MLLASITSSITDALTSFIGDQGVYAVFVLMLVDAVLPAASELVLYTDGLLDAYRRVDDVSSIGLDELLEGDGGTGAGPPHP